MEPDIPVVASLVGNISLEWNLRESHQLAGRPPLEGHDYRNQVLYYEDGQAFNLSSVDWTYATYFYDYDTNNNNINNNNTSYSELVAPERLVAVSMFIIMFAAGVVANAGVVYTVARYRAGRRGTRLYFWNISVADMLYLLMCLPSLCASYALVDWRFGDIFCKMENYVISVSLSVSALTILAAGLHQCLTITYPHKSRRFRTTKARLWMLSSVWILSSAVMAPRVLIFSQMSPTVPRDGRVTLCHRNSDSTIRKMDAALMFSGLYLLPLMVLVACCCVAGRAVWFSRLQDLVLAPPVNKADLHRRQRTAKMMFAMTALFAVGWLPFHLHQLVEDFQYGHVLFGEYVDRETVALFISFATKMFSPIFFCLFNASLKSYLSHTCTWKRGRGSSADHTSSLASTSPQKAEEIWPKSVVVPLPVTSLSAMLPPTHQPLTAHGAFTLEESSPLQPLLSN